MTEEGFLENPSDWNEEIARELASQEGIRLTADHWEIIYVLRDYYGRFQQPPLNMRLFVKAVQKQLGKSKGNSRYLHRLFPGNPLKRAARIAGLPKPPHCL